MPIETNTGSGDAAPNTTRENQERHTNFSGADTGSTGAAPTGAMDFTRLRSRIGINRIDGAIEPYLTKLVEEISKNLPDNNIGLVRMERMTNAYAIRYDGPDNTINTFGLVFVSPRDPANQYMTPASVRIANMNEELDERFAKDGRLRKVDARVVLVYPGDLDRVEQMANAIVSAFQVTCIAEVKNTSVRVLASSEYVAQWSLAEARAVENALSPHGVRPRIDVGLVVKAKINNNFGATGRQYQDQNAEYETLGVIGGYAEFRDRERVQDTDGVWRMKYRPVFNITTLLSTVPLVGVGALLLAAFAPTIQNSPVWMSQWRDLTDGKPNPGLLEEDSENPGRPYTLKDQRELAQFMSTYCTPPVVAFQSLDGGDNIPGMVRLVIQNPKAKQGFIEQLCTFFGTDKEDATQTELTRILETRFEGVYGDPSGTLEDSRNIDYLWIAAHQGFAAVQNPDIRRVLMNGSENPIDRAKLVKEAVHTFLPTNFNTTVAVNNAFIDWITEKAKLNRLTIVDPDSRMEARPLGSVLDGFGSASNMGSIISSMPVNRQGYSTGASIWSF